jgi:hypothetical protein
MLSFVLDQIDRFDNVWVMECRRDTEFRSQFLDVILFSLVLSPLSEFLDGIKLFFTSIPFVSKTNDCSRSLSDSGLVTYTVLLEKRSSTAIVSIASITAGFGRATIRPFGRRLLSVQLGVRFAKPNQILQGKLGTGSGCDFLLLTNDHRLAIYASDWFNGFLLGGLARISTS